MFGATDKWDARFLDLARHVATWSRDPSTQTGAVIVRPNRTIASVGYNGFPRDCNDDPRCMRTARSNIAASIIAK
jgi:dCMP deaminase